MASWLLSRLLYKSLDEEPVAEVLEYSPPDIPGPHHLSSDHLSTEPEAIRELLQDPRAMGSLEKLISESYKFIRMADDLHDVAQYLSDMRLCLVLVTATGYLLLIIYLFVLCMRRNRRNQPRRRNWDYQLESGRGDYNANTQSNGGDDLGNTVAATTRTDYMRNHRGQANSAPSFMRHGHMNHQQTTRLMADADGAAVGRLRNGTDKVKHQLPQITTDSPAEEKAKVPRLVKDSE